jgi:hypothetical protein
MQPQCNSNEWMYRYMQPRCNCNARRPGNGASPRQSEVGAQAKQARRKRSPSLVNETGELGLHVGWDHPHDARHAKLRRNKVVPGNSRDLRPGEIRNELIEICIFAYR